MTQVMGYCNVLTQMVNSLFFFFFFIFPSLILYGWAFIELGLDEIQAKIELLLDN